MVSDSFAATRNVGISSDLQKLAEVHLQHDLTEDDRQTLFEAAKKPSRFALIGSLVGLGLGAALAWKLRANRVRLFDAFRAMEKPTHVKFSDGRMESIPDITPYLQPTKIGDYATYAFFSIAGLFVGGEFGLLTGLAAAKRKLRKGNPETRDRVEKAFRGFKADILRRELADLEKGEGSIVLGKE